MLLNPSWALILIVPALVLWLPLALTVWSRRKALSAPVGARASVWFWCFRFLRFLNLGTVALWWIASDSVGLKPYAAAAWSRHGLESIPAGPALFLLFVWTPPIIVLVLCQALFQPVYQQVRGISFSRGDLARQALYGLGAWLVPGLCLIGGIAGTFKGQDFRGLALCGLLGFSCALGSGRGLRRQLELTPNALTTGELRDRAFSLAAALRIKLQQIYLLPAGKARMANAFARAGNSILLTEILLTRLRKREVDSVLAHELSHLKLDHPRWLGAALCAGFALVAVPYFTLSWSPALQPLFDLLFIVAPLLTFYFVARRFEYAADAGAVRLTGDPAGMITALVKLHHLNLLPLEWSRWNERMMTHPSTVRRALAIGRAASISEERVRELLAIPSEEGREAGSQDFYLLPAHASAEGKVFSTNWKQRIALRSFLAYIGFSLAVPALLLRALDLAGWAGSGFFAFLLVLFLAAGGALVLSNFLPFAGNRRLCARLREKLASQGLPAGPTDGVLVGLSPGSAPRIFEANYTWDAGVLVLDGDRFCYWGEETRFALARDEVASLSQGPGFPGWFQTRFLYLTAQSGDGGRPFTFNLRPLEVRSALEMKRALVDLERRLTRWKAGSRTGDTPSRPEPGPLRIGEVTSISPSEAWKPGQAWTLVMLVAFLGGFMASLAKLPVEWIAPRAYASERVARQYGGISGWYAIVLSTFSLLAFFGPLWFTRRAKVPRLEPVPPPPVPVEDPRRFPTD
jgi:Zn-dependent protease with chaperone function